MASKITLENLDAEVKKILSQYGDEVSANMGEIVTDITKKGVKALKAESASTFGESKQRKKKYKNTWTSKMVTGRLSKQGTIYNTQAGLPHLLENGHALVAGGRKLGDVPGRTHIAKVEEELARIFEQEVKRKL
jgi:hypothetical protein